MATVLSNSFYKFETQGEEKIPSDGGFILACNHVSLLDWMFLMAALAPRPVRFLIDETYTNMKFVGGFIGFSKPIPICVDTVRPRAMKRSLDQVVQALERNEVVGLFPEGGLTRTGELQPFRTGIELIVRRANKPVVPAALTGLWGSSWSRKTQASFWKKPLPFRPHIKLLFGNPILPSEFSTDRLEGAIRELLGEDVVPVRACP